jgi:hypothetical protein
VTGWWISSCTPVSFTNGTRRQDIAEILLKVALHPITLTVVNYEHNSLYELCIFNNTFNNSFNYIPGVSFIGRKMGTWRNHRITASQLQNLAHKLYRVPHAARVNKTHNFSGDGH